MIGAKIGMFQSEQGGEFSSRLLATWFRERGIVMRMTHESIEWNGLIERLRATLWSRKRAVMHARDVPISLWLVLVQAVSYLRNRLPATSLNGASPWARLHGCPVSSLEHLRVLGVPCVVQVSRPQDKLLPRSRPGILVGYMSDRRCKTVVCRV
jgi:hypothetical protein